MKDEAKSREELLAEVRQLQQDLSNLHAAEEQHEQREETLRESLALVQGIVETVREPLVVLDRDLKVVSANPAFYRTFKVTPEETERRFIYDLGNKQWDIPALRKLLEEIIPQNTFFDNFEVEQDFPGIGRKTMLLNARLIQKGEKRPEMILVAMEDITEVKQAQDALKKAYAELEQRVATRTQELALANRELQREIEERKRAEELLLQKAEELARSNADLEQFAYLVSHDLQEPLHVASGFVQLLARRYRDKLDAKANEFIARALESLSRMEQQIKDILEFSRVTTRGKEFALVDTNAVLDQVLKDLGATIHKKKARITHEPLPEVMADRAQLERVFQNLIGNALKFSGDQPPRVHIGAERLNGEWRFSVRDQGIGIDPRHFQRIFLMFERLHPREEYPGTGIGLAICKKIVERHGGRIWVESQPGRGATFYFTIPVRRRPEAPAEPGKPE
ncbi:MAG: ATP-binding protein [Deltaproteobacteria bacterium]|nr:ATP-binding protein [Deltaproteobacteria bacterium]